MKNLLSKRSGIKPFLAIDMLTQANKLKSKGKDIIHMDVGEPGIKPSKKLLKHIQHLIVKEDLGYTEPIGIPSLRHKIVEHYDRWYGSKIHQDNVAITSGASGAFVLSLLAAFDVGDEIAIMTPYYPAYINTLKALGLKINLLKGNVSNGFQPTLKILKEIKSNFKGLVIASPANPTGSIINKEEIVKIAHWCKKKNIKIISDEIYHGIEFESKSDTFFEYNNNALIINSFSKYFNMTGWRIGWIVAPKKVIQTIEKLSMALFLCPANLAQKVALYTIDDYSILEKNIKIYRKNRDFLIENFSKLGLNDYSPADGAFYLYLDVSKITTDSKSLALKLLNEAGVSCTPGYDFDDVDGHKYIRFSYAGEFNDVEKAASRISNWIKTKT